MSFTELNTVEHYIIHQLSGVNLNAKGIASEPLPAYGARWNYLPASALNREQTEVLVESEVKKALIRLNPEIAEQPDRADEVIYKLRTILLTVNSVGLVRANEEFARWMRGEMSMPFGKNYSHVPVKLIEFDPEKLDNNIYQVVNQLHIRNRETKIPDIVLYINGIPVVVGEAKTPIRPAVSWLDGASDIHDGYENSVPALFVPNILSFSTEGKEFFYGAVRTPLEFWSPWRTEDEPNELAKMLHLGDVGKQLSNLLNPKVLLDILYNFTTYTNNKKKQRIKVICRYQQYEGANLIVERAVENRIKKGLIWHFQGSGKSLLMLFAAQKLRKVAALRSPTVIIVVDRIDLDTQISGTFQDVPNTVTTDSIKELHDYLEKDARFIIITMIHKFKDAYENLNTRDNIILMVDEAHRTQEGNLGERMRAALPNAFLFGLTGTPINKADKNTFWAFGAKEDKGGYLSRYTFQDSIRDKATLPLHFEPRLLDIHIDKSQIDVAFNELANDLDEESKTTLSNKAAKMAVFLKSPERIQFICDDIVAHYREKVEPHGFKAMVVTPDREACHLYKQELDKLIPAEASAVVISTNGKGDDELKRLYEMSKDQQEKVLDAFNSPETPLKLLIVTAKLLTGFDAPILQTMYLDKSLKDHTLLQAICRTNRVYPQKNFGRIVDYFGVFDDTAKALQFDEETVKTIISNMDVLKAQVPQAMHDALSHFPGVDRMQHGFDGLQGAQECINTNEKRDAFAKDYMFVAKLWESLSPDAILAPYREDYKWISSIYASVKPAGPESTGKLLWMAFGAETTRLIHENIHVDKVHDDLEEMILDEIVVDELMHKQDPRKIKQLEKELIKRFQRHTGKPKFVELSKRLEDLRAKAEQGLISSIDFIKELCQLAKETVQAEKEDVAVAIQKDAKAALSELFMELRTEDTPAVVGRIVDDIDNIVKIVRFPGWQTTVAGEREVQKALRKTLLKYKLHKEEELFNKAYLYIKEYY